MNEERKQRIPDALLWVIAIVGAGLFLLAGAMKLLGYMDEEFIAWGYSPGFAWFIGIIEIFAGLGLLHKRSSGWASLCLIALMAGAAVTHITHGEYLMVLLPVAVMACLALLLAGRGLQLTPPAKPATS